jgi:glycosyltransferase involved in cell wall biosynthesis
MPPDSEKQSMAKVSVVIPTYNCAGYLGRALDSVLAQTMQDFQIVIADDGSTDDTQDAIRPYLTDPRISSIVQANQGLPGARNAGVRASSAAYLAFLDADDELAPNALDVLTATLDSQPAMCWCVSDVLRICGPERAVLRSQIPEDSLFYGILRDDFIRRGMFMRRDSLVAVGLYDVAMKIREDWDLNIRLVRAGMPFVYIPEPLYWYHWRRASITTGNPSKALAYTGALLRKHHKAIADAGDARAARIYAENMWHLGRTYFHATGNLPKTLKCVLESLKYNLDLGRVVHPLLHHVHAAFARRRSFGAMRSNEPG